MLLLGLAGCVSAENMPENFYEVPLSYDYPAAASPVNLSQMRANFDTDGFVRIEDGHFYNDAGRIRFFGVNLSFSAMFPDAQQAVKLAE